jgi:hypothetical protein
MNPPVRTSRRFGLPSIAILLTCATAILLQRLHTYSEPLENDITGYAVIAHEMLHGRLLYTDLWERKPPLIYGIFELAESITGYGRGEIFLINLAAALATLAAIYLAGCAGPHGKTGGWIAAIFWTLLCGDLFMQANQPNAEVLLNVFLTGAFALLVNWPTRTKAIPVTRASGPCEPQPRDGHSDPPAPNARAGGPCHDCATGEKRGGDKRGSDPFLTARFLSALLLGILFSGAMLIKHHVIITCLAMMVAHLVCNAGAFRRRLIELAITGAVIVVSGSTVFGYFALHHRLHDLIDVLFHQNAQYAGDLVHNLIVSLSWSNIARPFLSWMFCPVALVLLFMVFAIRHRRWNPIHPWLMWLIWALGTWPAVVLPGHLFPHYYQLWIPVWCIAAGWAGAGILDHRIAMPMVLRYGSIAATLTVLFCRELSPYSLTPDQWADQKYSGGNYGQQKYLGEYLGKTLLKENESFWVLGDDISLYFESRKSPPSGLLYVDPLIDGDEIRRYQLRLLTDLQETQPDLILESPLTERMPPDAPVFAWIDQHYTRWPTAPGGPFYRSFTRNGSPLARRAAL